MNIRRRRSLIAHFEIDDEEEGGGIETAKPPSKHQRHPLVLIRMKYIPLDIVP